MVIVFVCVIVIISIARLPSLIIITFWAGLGWCWLNEHRTRTNTTSPVSPPAVLWRHDAMRWMDVDG